MFHEDFNLIELLEKEEVFLCTEIAAMVPNKCLREAILEMLQNEKCKSKDFWKKCFPDEFQLEANTTEESENKAELLDGGEMIKITDSCGCEENIPHALIYKLERVVKIDCRELACLAGLIYKVDSPLTRMELIEKVNKELNELRFWNTLILAFEKECDNCENKEVPACC